MTKGFKPHTDMHGDDILVRCREHLKNANAIKQQLVRNAEPLSLPSLLNLYNDILIETDAGLSQASLLSQVHPKEEIRKLAETCEQELSEFVTALTLDADIYQMFSSKEPVGLTDDGKRMLERTLREFKRAGVDKDEATRSKIKNLKAELIVVGQEFGENIRSDRKVIKLDGVEELDGLPEDYRLSHKPGADGKIEISTDYPDYIPFMQYAKNDKRRKEIRYKYLNRGEKNGPVLQAMIEKRSQLAKQLLSYGSYADYVAEDKMIKQATAIHEFIDKVAHMAEASADQEFAALLNFKQTFDKTAQEIYGHESAYLEDAYKKSQFNYDSQEARPYFSYQKVQDGLLHVTSTLFNIRYEPVPGAKVWHPSVTTYEVYDESGKLGRIYLDMHPRDGKFKHAAQFTVVSGLKNRQYPEGALVCNFPDPKDGPALMEHRQVVTMFHEFGHLLHHLFAGKQNWMPFSGVATEWDFVEAPSQLLEEWPRSLEVLSMFAKHYETGETIPADLVNKIRAAEEFGKAMAARQQMFYAALSVNYYDKDPQLIDLLGDLKNLQEKYSYYPYEEGTHFNYSFGHLVDYSAMYYTYMWSLSLAKDLFEPFKQQGIMNSKIAQKYRDTVLKPGGSKDAHDLVKDFLGRPFKFDAFSRWLTSN